VAIDQSYNTINLLNKALCMSEGMITMIRYYSAKYEWIEDYNTTMAIDIRSIYRRLKESMVGISAFY
jgi:hypothetical protein